MLNPLLNGTGLKFSSGPPLPPEMMEEVPFLWSILPARIAFDNAFLAGRPVLLEPVVHIEVTVPAMDLIEVRDGRTLGGVTHGRGDGALSGLALDRELRPPAPEDHEVHLALVGVAVLQVAGGMRRMEYGPLCS